MNYKDTEDKGRGGKHTRCYAGYMGWSGSSSGSKI